MNARCWVHVAETLARRKAERASCSISVRYSLLAPKIQVKKSRLRALPSTTVDGNKAI